MTCKLNMINYSSIPIAQSTLDALLLNSHCSHRYSGPRTAEHFRTYVHPTYSNHNSRTAIATAVATTIAEPL